METKYYLGVAIGELVNGKRVAVFTAKTCLGGERASLDFIGASCEASVLPHSKGLSSFSILVPDGKDAEIALTINLDRHKALCERSGVLVPVYWEDSKMIINLTDPLLPRPVCLGQVLGDELVMVVGGKRFSTCAPHEFDSVNKKW